LPHTLDTWRISKNTDAPCFEDDLVPPFFLFTASAINRALVVIGGYAFVLAG
jgi:hypothetical protein